jgi:hypothetical protein
LKLIIAGPDRSSDDRETSRPLVRQSELRHRLAEPWADLASIERVQSLDQFVISLGKVRAKPIACLAIRRQARRPSSR